MISSPNERMGPGNRRNLIAENLTPKKDKGHRSGVIEAQKTTCSIRGLKRTDIENHYEGRTQKHATSQ